MKRSVSRLLALGTALALCLSMLAPAMAARKTEHINILKPDKKTYYVGDSIPYHVFCYRPSGMSGVVTMSLKNKATKKTVWKDEDHNSFQDDSTDVMPYEWKIDTKKFAPGTYIFAVNVDVGTTYDWEIEAEGGEQSPYHSVDETASVTLALKLKKPGGLKAKAGKKKASVSWKKVTGAKKYEVYRSAKKKSGYKKVSTVKTNKLTDKKKLKKGKKYYYKVRAVNGKSKSAFSAVKQSGKVK